MTSGYLSLLLGDIAAHLDDFHTVKEGTGDGVEIVGGGDEQYLREIVINVEVVVVECRVLFGVEHFEQCRCRVAVHGVLRHLIYLVEHEDRVG